MEIYVDESGNLSKYYEGSNQPRYFTLSFIITDDTSVTANIAVDLIQKYGLNQELKHANASDKIKRKFIDLYLEALEDCTLQAYTLIIDTKDIPERHNIPNDDPEHAIYTILSQLIPLAFEDVDPVKPVTLTFDHRWNKSSKKEQLNQAVKDEVNESFDNVKITCRHEDSRKEKNIQVADMIAGLSRRYEENNAHPYYRKKLVDHVKTYRIDLTIDDS